MRKSPRPVRRSAHQFSVSLDFKTIPCARCGAQRILSVACPDCGAAARGGEVDSNVVRRRQGLARVGVERARVAQDVRARVDSEGFTALLEEMLEALGAFSRAPLADGSILRLARALAAIDTSQEKLAIQARRRPGMGLTRARQETVARLDSVWREYEGALLASTPMLAQLAADKAQALMDTAADPIAAAGQLERMASILEDESLAIPLRVVNALEERFPDTPFLALLATGGARAADQLGVEVGPNSGLSYMLLESVGARYLNPDRFSEKLRVCAIGARRPERLAAIATMDGAVEALSETHRLVVEAAIAYGAAIAKDSDERSVVRRTGRLVSELYEAGSAAFGWYRLLERDVVSNDAFDRQLDDSVTSVVAQLQKGSLSSVFDDAARFLRNAPNHGRSFDFDPASRLVLIRLNSHPETSIELDDYVDRAFAFLETLLASIWGLENALELANIDVSLSDADALYLGFSPITLAAAALPRVADITVDRFHTDGDVWYFDVTTAQQDLLIPALSIASIPRADTKKIVLRGGDDPELVVSLSSWQEFVLEDDPSSKMMSFLRTKSLTSLGGEPVLTASDVQFLLATLGKDAMEGDMSTVRHLRQIRTWSIERGWVREADLSTRLMAATRGVGVESVQVEVLQLIPLMQTPTMPTSRVVRVLVDA